jgi:hypothetical protein
MVQSFAIPLMMNLQTMPWKIWNQLDEPSEETGIEHWNQYMIRSTFASEWNHVIRIQSSFDSFTPRSDN